MSYGFEIRMPEEKRYVYNDTGVMAAQKWALAQFGLPGWQGDMRWNMNPDGVFFFEREADATLFALKWS